MTDSWWLKVKRAQKHMVDIDEEEARRYAGDDPYKFIRVRIPDNQGKIRHRLRITAHPDPIVAIMFGDFIHNLRGALDHIIVASVPQKHRRNASFPILHQDIWAKDNDGQFIVNNTSRENFEAAVSGLHPTARARVIALQPYQFGDNSDLSIVGIISSLDNADKHRELLAVGSSMRNIAIRYTYRGASVDSLALGGNSLIFAQDDTVIDWNAPSPEFRTLPDGTIIQPSEMQMEFTGAVEILVKVARRRGNDPADFALRSMMLRAIQEVRGVLRMLEPFVRR